MMLPTTIKISVETREKLWSMKGCSNETYDGVINRMIDEINKHDLIEMQEENGKSNI